MDERIKTLHLEIGGRWTVRDMALCLEHTRDLYNLSVVLGIITEDWKDTERFWVEFWHFPPFRKRWRRRVIDSSMLPLLMPWMPAIPSDPEALSRLASYLYPQEELEILRINYGSEGFSDLIGVGEAVGHVKDFILKLIEHWLGRRQRNLDNEKRELKNERLRIENAREFVKLVQECGYSESEIRRLVRWVDERQETFIFLIESEKLIGVRILEEKSNTISDD
ncbi:MAG: hypothetical protein AB1473_09280 [Thermodesulfobacteriota bacterium]